MNWCSAKANGRKTCCPYYDEAAGVTSRTQIVRWAIEKQADAIYRSSSSPNSELQASNIAKSRKYVGKYVRGHGCAYPALRTIIKIFLGCTRLQNTIF